MRSALGWAAALGQPFWNDIEIGLVGAAVSSFQGLQRREELEEAVAGPNVSLWKGWVQESPC